MKHNLFSFPYSWIWFVAGMLVFGLPAEFIFNGSRNFWGAVGGVLFVAVGGAVYKQRHGGSTESDA